MSVWIFSPISPRTTMKSVSFDTRLMPSRLHPVFTLQNKVQSTAAWFPSSVHHAYDIKNHCAAVGKCCAVFFCNVCSLEETLHGDTVFRWGGGYNRSQRDGKISGGMWWSKRLSKQSSRCFSMKVAVACLGLVVSYKKCVQLLDHCKTTVQNVLRLIS